MSKKQDPGTVQTKALSIGPLIEGLFYLRLTFALQSCILIMQVNIPFECLWTW